MRDSCNTRHGKGDPLRRHKHFKTLIKDDQDQDSGGHNYLPDPRPPLTDEHTHLGEKENVNK